MASARMILVGSLNPKAKVLEEMETKGHVSYIDTFNNKKQALKVEVELTLPSKQVKTFIVDRFITNKPVMIENITGENLLMKLVEDAYDLGLMMKYDLGYGDDYYLRWCSATSQDPDKLYVMNNYKDAVENNTRFKTAVGKKLYEKLVMASSLEFGDLII